MVCRTVTVNTWGCHPKIMNWLYTVIVGSIVPIWGGCMVEESGLCTAKKQLDQNSETRKRLHNGGWEGDEILSQSRHGGTATHHAPAPSGGHGNTIETSKNFPREKITFGAQQSIWKLPRDLLWSGNMFLEENFNAY